MRNDEKMNVEMTVEEARLFVEFRRFQQQFTSLEKCGFFAIKGGSAMTHFDSDGKIRKVERHDVILAS